MNEAENIGSFVKDNSKLAKKWLDARVEVYRLMAIRFAAKSAGILIWALISLFILFLLLVFCGITTGFWLSSVTGSYVAGFGIVTGAIILLLLILAKFRSMIFINPIIRALTSDAVKKEKENKQ